jgi:hypothetical protein
MSRQFFVELKWECENKHLNEGHLKVCEVCGKPKTDVDGDIDDGGLTPVADESFVEQAAAGVDWKCRFCGSAERRDSGECVQCGVSQDQGETPRARSFSSEAPTRPEGRKTMSSYAPPPILETRRRSKGLPWWAIAIPIVLALIIGGYFLFKPLDLHGTVTALAWQRTIHIDRYSLRHDSGFTVPSGALNLVNDGQRQNGWNYHVLVGHHRVTDASLCGTKNCRTDRSSCTTPKPVCTKLNNGFKSCTQADPVCSTICDPKTCSVNDYADLPIYADFYEWDFWGWGHNRDAMANGTTSDVRWPDTTPPPLQDGEQERESGREESYTVTFTGRKGDSWPYTPKSYSEFETYQLGSRHRIRVMLGSVSSVFD